jgi:hypothetical protein
MQESLQGCTAQPTLYEKQENRMGGREGACTCTTHCNDWERTERMGAQVRTGRTGHTVNAYAL